MSAMTMPPTPTSEAGRDVAPRPAATGAPAEPRLALPTVALLVWVVFASLLVAGAWSAIVAVGNWGHAALVTGAVGVSATTIVSLAAIMLMTPWRVRPIGDWMNIWLAGTVFRMLVTPGLLFLLYSATSPTLAAKPLVLSVALTYLVGVLTEAGIIASHVRRSLPPLR